MLYFAYGSNLNLSQMSRRCPRATPLDKIYLPDWKLVFRGVCDVVEEGGASCPGGLWRITPDCELALDRYEGYDARFPMSGMYRKVYVTVDGLPDGETEVMFYVMNSRGIYPPSEGYYNGVRQGYRDFGLRQAPLRLALKHAHDASHPSHVERRRMRRNGRPPLASRPQPKQREQRKRAKVTQVYHDPWGAHCPAEKRRQKIGSLDEWLAERRATGRST
jgi:hypothetical protein